LPRRLTSYVPHALILNNDVAAKDRRRFCCASKKTPDDDRGPAASAAPRTLTLERFKAATGADITQCRIAAAAPCCRT